MQIDNGQVIASATDIVGFLHCEHLTWLERQAALGKIQRPANDHPMLELLRGEGHAHEDNYRKSLKRDGLRVEDATKHGGDSGSSTPSPSSRRANTQASSRRTLDLMNDGVDVIFQATFIDDEHDPHLIGFADFLRRVDHHSDLGDWSYEPEDTKLSSHVSAWAVLQLCVYAELLEREQGRQPEYIHVVLGSGERASIRLSEVLSYFRKAKERFDAFIALDPATPPYPLPVSHCARCGWQPHCSQRWRADDHLSQVAFIRMEQVKKLERAGVPTMTALAQQPDGLSVPNMGDETVNRLIHQARLQVAAQVDQPPPWKALPPPEPGLGLSMLPKPSKGDVFYDIEGHPYAIPGGLEYLHGLGTIKRGAFTFEEHWAHDVSEERRAFERIIDYFTKRKKKWPDMHVYHYAHYEVTALKKMAMRHGTREDELDDLLRSETFVDLYKVVRQGVLVGVSSYSIKRLEPLYMTARVGDIGNGGSSILEYEKWRNGGGDDTILDEILLYNKDDVESTQLLRDWLEERRSELVDAGVDVPRPELKDIAAGAKINVEIQRRVSALLAGIDPADIERIRNLR